jgi:hypothetical protein
MVLTDHPAAPGASVPYTGTFSTTGTEVLSLTQLAFRVTYTSSNWYQKVTVPVVADPWFDIQPGHENFKAFPKRQHRLDGIRGPRAVEGGMTSADRSLRPAILLPGEANGPFFGVPPQPPETHMIDVLNKATSTPAATSPRSKSSTSSWAKATTRWP